MITMNRRDFLKSTLAATAAAGLPNIASANNDAPPTRPAKADAMILIWLPGGVAQTDTWDPKKHTPYMPGMKGSELLGTCPIIPTSADGISFGAGLEHLASVMNQGTVLRSLTNQRIFSAVHLKAQYHMMTGHPFPTGVRAPSMGAVVARALGRRDPHVPAYVDIGRDIDSGNQEFLFINEYQGPGFYGPRFAPFLIPDPTQGLRMLSAVAGMRPERLDRRRTYLQAVNGFSVKELRDSQRAREFATVMNDARTMLDSPVKKTFEFTSENPQTLMNYDVGHRFGKGCLLARRLVEAGARFVEVEYPYAPFAGFDMHDNGKRRMENMKKQIDRPIAQLVRDLDERGLLERTLVVVMSEFGRTIAAQPGTVSDSNGFAEHPNGEQLIIDNEKGYGFHSHFSSCNSMLFFGGGFKKGFAYGKSAHRHPMVAVENPVNLEDVHATIYKALGIDSDTHYVTQGQPFYVTKDGGGRAIDVLLA